jgi:enoyl-CoA hydratase
MAKTVDYTSAEGVASIRIDDGKVNAMGPAFFDELNAALDSAEQQQVGAVVLIGRAGYFSAGLNVKLLPTLPPDEITRTLQAFGHTLLRVWTLPIPTVAAVTGHAVAGGLFLALACDTRLVARGAFRLHANEHAIGLPLPSWALAITESAVPTASYNELMLHARAFSPDEALARGMINGVEDSDRLEAAAGGLGTRLKGIAGSAYAASKRRLRARPLEWAAARIPEEMTGFAARS